MCLLDSSICLNNTDAAKKTVQDYLVKVSFDKVMVKHAAFENANLNKEDLTKIRDVSVSSEIIKFHLKQNLRPMLNLYCRHFDSHVTWRKITADEQAMTRYKYATHSVYFGTLHFNSNSREKLHEYDATPFKDLDMLAERCLLSKFREMGFPPADCKGWIWDGYKDSPLPDLVVRDINTFVTKEHAKNPDLSQICVSTLASYQKQYLNLQSNKKANSAEDEPPPKKKRRIIESN